MRRGPDATTLLLRALARHAATFGLDVAFTVRRATPWASVTFDGVQHELSATAAAGQSLTDWLNDLPEAELVLRGHTADVSVEEISTSQEFSTAVLTILTIAE